MKPKSILFLIISNLIIVSIVLGLCVAFVDLSNPIRLATFILLLITLLIPSMMVLIFKGFGSAASILTFSFFIINLVATTILFSISINEIKPLIITEVIIFGLYLAFMFVALGESTCDNKDNEKSAPN